MSNESEMEWRASSSFGGDDDVGLRSRVLFIGWILEIARIFFFYLCGRNVSKFRTIIRNGSNELFTLVAWICTLNLSVINFSKNLREFEQNQAKTCDP